MYMYMYVPCVFLIVIWVCAREAIPLMNMTLYALTFVNTNVYTSTCTYVINTTIDLHIHCMFVMYFWCTWNACSRYVHAYLLLLLYCNDVHSLCSSCLWCCIELTCDVLHVHVTPSLKPHVHVYRCVHACTCTCMFISYVTVWLTLQLLFNNPVPYVLWWLYLLLLINSCLGGYTRFWISFCTMEVHLHVHVQLHVFMQP